MKPKQLFSFLIVAIYVWLMPFDAYSQHRDLEKSLLVYIMPDSLELPPAEKGMVPYTTAHIRSRSLQATLDRVNPVSIGKAFPDWNVADSIRITAEGVRVKTPKFGRIFTLNFILERKQMLLFRYCRKNFRCYSPKRI